MAAKLTHSSNEFIRASLLCIIYYISIITYKVDIKVWLDIYNMYIHHV